jgi:hypothetical protein
VLEQVDSCSDENSFFDNDGGDKVELNDHEVTTRVDIDSQRMAQVLVTGRNTYENPDDFIDEYRSELYASELMSEFQIENTNVNFRQKAPFDTDDDTLTLNEHSETKHAGSESDFTQLSHYPRVQRQMFKQSKVKGTLLGQ